MSPCVSHSRVQRRGVSWLLAAAALALFTMAAVAAGATDDLPEVVATVQDKPITAEALTAELRGELLRLDMQRYQLLKDKLDTLVTAQLVRLEAEKRGLPLEKFEQDEIHAKVQAVTPEQVKAFYEANKQRIRQPFEQIEPQITAYLQKQAEEKRRDALQAELLPKYKVNIALRAPRVDISADDDPVLGSKDALVTIIEFSDFECPYCRRVQETLKRVMEEYQGKVKLVFRDFPLRQAHPQAQKAAEAAQCAAEQGQFWPYHDKLFATSNLQTDELKKYAKELGLKEEQFNTCLDSNKYAAEVEKDLQDGQKVGVGATPSFFINGYPLSGAVPFERFKEVIDTALTQAQSAQKTN